MTEQPRPASPDHFISPENREGVVSISVPNIITRIAPGAETILGPCEIGKPYALEKFVIPIDDGAYSTLGNDEAAKLRYAGQALLRARAGRHYHDDLTLDTPPGFRTEYEPGTVRYGINAVRHVVSKGGGLSITPRESDTETPQPRFWYFDPTYVRDAEASVRGLCSEKEALDDWRLSDRLNKRGGRFGVPLLTTAFTHIPALRKNVEPGYAQDNQVLLYDVDTLRSAEYASSGRQTILPYFDTSETDDVLNDDERDEMTFGKPVDYKRGFVSGIRVGNLSNNLETLKSQIQTTIRAIQREDASVIDEKSYLDWFAKQMANNLALIHAENLCHTQLTHRLLNVTLAAEVVDNSGARDPRTTNHTFDFHDDLGDPKDWSAYGAVGAVLAVLEKCRLITKKVLFSNEELQQIFFREYVQRIHEYYSHIQPPPTFEPEWLQNARKIETEILRNE